MKAQYGTSASLSSIIAPIDSSSRFSYTVRSAATPRRQLFPHDVDVELEVLRLVLEKRLRAIQKVSTFSASFAYQYSWLISGSASLHTSVSMNSSSYSSFTSSR